MSSHGDDGGEPPQTALTLSSPLLSPSILDISRPVVTPTSHIAVICLSHPCLSSITAHDAHQILTWLLDDSPPTFKGLLLLCFPPVFPPLPASVPLPLLLSLFPLSPSPLMSTYRQDMPPKGGFAPIHHIPDVKRKGFSNITLLGIASGLILYGITKYIVIQKAEKYTQQHTQRGDEGESVIDSDL